jgi:hypothetical protein
MDSVDGDIEFEASTDDGKGSERIGEGGIKVIQQRHQIPELELQDLNFNRLGTYSRDISDGEAMILPYVAIDDNGYVALVKHPDDPAFAKASIVWDGDLNVRGWCSCAEFGYTQVCRHLFILYRWRNGILEPHNIASAQELLDRLDVESDSS